MTASMVFTRLRLAYRMPGIPLSVAVRLAYLIPTHLYIVRRSNSAPGIEWLIGNYLDVVVREGLNKDRRLRAAMVRGTIISRYLERMKRRTVQLCIVF